MAKIKTTNYDNQVAEDLRAEAKTMIVKMASNSKTDKSVKTQTKENQQNNENKEENETLYEKISKDYERRYLTLDQINFFESSRDIYIFSNNVRMNDNHTEVMMKNNFVPVCDFPFFVKSLIRDKKENVWYIVQIGAPKEISGKEPIYMTLTNKQFSTANAFAEKVSEQQKIFYSSNMAFLQIRNAMPTVAESEYVSTLGWSSSANAYFFSNVCIKDGKPLLPDEFGLVKIKDKENNERSFFMPYVESITGGISLDDNARAFTYVENKEITFNKWFQLLYNAHKHYCILPTCFMIATIFRDLIFAETKFMPIMYIKGVRGSGKSSIARNLTSIFGTPQKEISLKSNLNTPKALARICDQKSNAFIWFDEFHNNLETRTQGMMQSFYDGAGYNKASFSNDNKTETIEIKSGLCLTSNFLPEDEIFFTRTILIQANETVKTEQQRTAFKQLTELERGNLSCICCELLQYRELIEKEFKHTYEALFKFFFDQLSGIDTRFFDNMACILAPVVILLENHKINMVELNYTQKLCDYAIQVIKQQVEILNENKVDIDFWNAIQILYNQNQIRKNFDFRLLEKEENGKKEFDAILAIRIKTLYLHYQKFLGNRAKSDQEITENIINSNYFIKKDVKRFFKEDGQSQTNTNCLLLDYKKLQTTIGVTFD